MNRRKQINIFKILNLSYLELVSEETCENMSKMSKNLSLFVDILCKNCKN